MGFLERKKTVSEMEEESEKLDAEISYAQKQELLRRLKQQGGSPEVFRGPDGKISFSAMANWLKAKIK